jgi:hypothetical protein
MAGAQTSQKEQVDMKRIRILGLAMLALFAFGAVVAATAAAEEKEPAGLLFLEKEGPPVKMEGTGGTATLETLPGGAKIVCTANTFKATAGVKGETHVTLGTVTIDFTGCTFGAEGAISCSSETEAGVKDAAKTILVEADLHFVSLETSAGKLVPGLFVMLLKDVIINCGGTKILVLGIAIGEVEKASATADVTEIGLNFVAIPKLLACDKNDKLCKEEKEKFACATSGSLCANVTGTHESADQVAKATVKISPMVAIDF